MSVNCRSLGWTVGDIEKTSGEVLHGRVVRVGEY